MKSRTWLTKAFSYYHHGFFKVELNMRRILTKSGSVVKGYLVSKPDNKRGLAWDFWMGEVGRVRVCVDEQ